MEYYALQWRYCRLCSNRRPRRALTLTLNSTSPPTTFTIPAGCHLPCSRVSSVDESTLFSRVYFVAALYYPILNDSAVNRLHQSKSQRRHAVPFPKSLQPQFPRQRWWTLSHVSQISPLPPSRTLRQLFFDNQSAVTSVPKNVAMHPFDVSPIGSLPFRSRFTCSNGYKQLTGCRFE